MSLQAAVFRLVEESDKGESSLVRSINHHQSTDPKSKSSTPNLEYSISTFRYSRGISEGSNMGVSGSGYGAVSTQKSTKGVFSTHIVCLFPAPKSSMIALSPGGYHISTSLKFLWKCCVCYIVIHLHCIQYLFGNFGWWWIVHAIRYKLWCP
jgi:hypothetical protein